MINTPFPCQTFTIGMFLLSWEVGSTCWGVRLTGMVLSTRSGSEAAVLLYLLVYVYSYRWTNLYLLFQVDVTYFYCSLWPLSYFGIGDLASKVNGQEMKWGLRCVNSPDFASTADSLFTFLFNLDRSGLFRYLFLQFILFVLSYIFFYCATFCEEYRYW